MSQPATDEAQLREITVRHGLDHPWFTGGLHDPNGYVAMAHKDRGELLERLRALRTGEAKASPGDIVIPMYAYLWLMGEGPDDKGFYFGEARGIAESGNYWWRTTFRRMCGL